MDKSIFEEKSSLKILELPFSSKLDWGSYIVSVPQIVSKKTEALVHPMTFLSPEVFLYLFISSVCLSAESCCHVWACACRFYLDKLDKLDKRVFRTVGLSLAASPCTTRF